LIQPTTALLAARMSPSNCSSTVISSPASRRCTRARPAAALSLRAPPIRSVAPATSPMRSSMPDSAWRSLGIWSIDRSSTGVPNRAMAVLARVAGSLIASRPLTVFISAARASGPPLAMAVDILCALRPISW